MSPITRIWQLKQAPVLWAVLWPIKHTRKFLIFSRIVDWVFNSENVMLTTWNYKQQIVSKMVLYLQCLNAKRNKVLLGDWKI